MTKTSRFSTFAAALLGASLIGAVSSAEARCVYYGPGSTGCAPPAGYKPAPVAQPAPAPKPTMQVGGAVVTGNAYTFASKSGQSGNVTFFGSPPSTYQGHNGQVGNVTFLGGAKPYTLPSRPGQVGGVTVISTQPVRGAVPIRTIPTPGVIVRRP
jgi:hypothetical protein